MPRLLKLALLAVSALAVAVAVPALADYLGPARHVVDLVEVRDPTNDYWTCHHAAYAQPCILHHPDNPCPDCGGHHPSKEQQSYWCGWPSGDFSGYLGCDCTPAYAYQQVEYDLPEATIAGDLLNCVVGNGGWCLSSPTLHLTADEPLTGYTILAIEGSRGVDPFACPGAICDVPLAEGENAFAYWALSSYGDSSRMGNLTAWVDTVPPTSAFTNPAEGSQVWASGDLSLAGISADATSGLAGTELSFDGGATWTSPSLNPDGTWSYVWDTHAVGDGTYPLQARAWDVAGNLGTSAQVTVLVDNTGPLVDIPDRWNIWEEAPLVVDDGGIGLAGVRVTILGGEYGSRTYDYSPGTLPGAVVWDRRFAAPGDPPGTFSILAPIGEYEVAVAAWDHQGNQANDAGVLVIPSPGAAPTETAASAAAAAVPPTARPTITRIQAATITPTRTATPVAVAALPVVEQGAAGLVVASAPAAATGGSNLPLWGAAALALAAGATAYALTRRREREAEHEAELDRKRNQAAEWAARAAALKAQVEANKQTARSAAAVVAAAAAVAADGARRFADRRVERLEERLHAQEVQAQERARLEAARQREAEEQRRAEEAERARAAAAAAAAERLRAIAQGRDEPAPAAEAPWWQRAWDGVRQAADRAITWVDQHQVAVAIGIGVVAGAAAVLLTGGIAAPLIVGALAAGGVSALGTVGLNAYFGRPLGTNVLRNAGLSAGAAVLTTGAGLAVRAGLVGRAALAAGNTVAALCGRNPAACARAEGVLQAMDTAEQVVLQAQLAFQTATGDPRAAETALALQLEYMDGGLPGNTAIRELGDVGQDALSSVANYGDEAAEVATVLQRHSDDVLDVLDDGVIHVRPDVAEELGDELAEVLAGRNVRVLRSTTSGAVYASVPTRQALDALDELEAIAHSGRTSGDDVERLIETLAAASTRGAGDRVVLGPYGSGGIYIQEALDGGGVFFDATSQVWARMEGIGVEPWLVNEAFLRQQLASGIDRIEIVGEDIPSLLARYIDDPLPPARVREIRWLESNAGSFGYSRVGNTWLRVVLQE